MAASKHRAGSRPADPSSRRYRGRDSADADAGSVQALLDHGMQLRLRAPELALVCGERAASLAEAADVEHHWIRAEALAVFARVRLGHRAGVVDRAMAALRAAEAGGHTDVIALLRTDLALCARSIGVPLTGFAALRPVLASRDIGAADRAVALLQLVGCLGALGRRGALDRALNEAARLADADGTLDADGRLLLRAGVAGRTAAHLRRHGDISASLDYARRGLDALDQLQDSSADGGQLRVRLVLELTCALLDTGARDEATALAEPLLKQPARAAAASPMAWLRLALATRVYLPSGAAEAAGAMVREALYFARRHDLHALAGRLLHELAHIEEQLGRASEAIRCLQEARIAEHTYVRARKQASSLLTGEFGKGEHTWVDIESLLGAAAPQQPQHPQQAPQVQQPQPPQEPQQAPSARPVGGRDGNTVPTVPIRRGTGEHPGGHPPGHAAAQAQGPPAAAGAGAPGAGQHHPPAAAASAHAAPDHGAAAGTGAQDSGARQAADTGPSARDVLARLGVTVGSGGRRRADDQAGPSDRAEAGDQDSPAGSHEHRQASAGSHQHDTRSGTRGEQPPPFPRLRLPEGLEPRGRDSGPRFAGPAEPSDRYGGEPNPYAGGSARAGNAAGFGEPPASHREPAQPNFDEMDSLLEVFSNWSTGSEGASGDGAAREGRHRQDRAVPYRSADEQGVEHPPGTNGRVIGPRFPGGRHRGEA
ncbi:hypothetical protein [Haloechinothrix sp. LS1_15]|uniref:hypothetical protein n=1 Tax=Haloechinothrix sp. LS1_15 TaxID=2652248 RepID=UPI002944E606|nr:hypothetical protein [Haloechinothrix sp. LS1_15]MDV6011987.1 hypothetical protein [Haloechinothrix sp. LS1_15]